MFLAILVLLALATATGWIAGRNFEASRGSPLTTEESLPPVITAKVEFRQLADSAIVPATLRIRDAKSVRYEGDIARPILTAIPASIGEPIIDGTILYEVSGEPVVAFVGAAVEYRDLVRGAKGADVLDLQLALARLGYLEIEPDGSFGAATASAVRRFFTDLGFTWDGLAFGHYLFVPEGTKVIDVTALPRTRLGPDDVILTYAAGEFEAVADFTAAQTSLWVDNSKAFLEGDRQPLSLIESIPNENGTTSFVFSTPSSAISNTPGSSVRLEIVFSATDGDVLVVPLSALNITTDGAVFVRRLVGDRPSQPIEVQPGLEVDGWVEIDVDPSELSHGDEVVLGATDEF
jgi:peptidoglycan hydrolase-like protein with peptidoglycan-binding domain